MCWQLKLEVRKWSMCIPQGPHTCTSIIMAEPLKNGYLTVFSPEKSSDYISHTHFKLMTPLAYFPYTLLFLYTEKLHHFKLIMYIITKKKEEKKKKKKRKKK